MRLAYFAVLMSITIPLFADKPFDGFFLSGNAFLAKSKIDLLGVDVKISDTRPMITVGYAREGKRIKETDLRLFAGVEAFYIGSSKRRGATEKIYESQTEQEIAEKSPLVEDEIRTTEIKQNGTWGTGIRVGLSETGKDSGGVLYVSFGYTATEVEGEGYITHDNFGTILRIDKDKVNFNGFYIGGAYEYAFSPVLSMHVGVMTCEYGSKTLSVTANSGATTLTDPGGIDLDSSGAFIGLTGRF